MPRVRLLGDIAFYYLTYVDAIAERNENVRFICLRRDEEETVASWMRKSAVERWRSKRLADRLASWITRERYHKSGNFWMDHDGREWLKDPLWDKCFPKFDAPSKPDAIRRYWRYYYEVAEEIAGAGPIGFGLSKLRRSAIATQRELLEFCKVPPDEQVLTDAHIHRSSQIESGFRAMATMSVIIATRNRPALFAAALESVLRQSAPPAEVIVVDDGSDEAHRSGYARGSRCGGRPGTALSAGRPAPRALAEPILAICGSLRRKAGLLCFSR